MMIGTERSYYDTEGTEAVESAYEVPSYASARFIERNSEPKPITKITPPKVRKFK